MAVQLPHMDTFPLTGTIIFAKSWWTLIIGRRIRGKSLMECSEMFYFSCIIHVLEKKIYWLKLDFHNYLSNYGENILPDVVVRIDFMVVVPFKISLFEHNAAQKVFNIFFSDWHSNQISFYFVLIVHYPPFPSWYTLVVFSSFVYMCNK